MGEARPRVRFVAIVVASGQIRGDDRRGVTATVSPAAEERRAGISKTYRRARTGLTNARRSAEYRTKREDESRRFFQYPALCFTFHERRRE